MSHTGSKVLWGAVFIAASFLLAACEVQNGDIIEEVDIPAADMEYVLVAWNDVGMHCLNPTYNEAVLLPPYNTLWAQLILRGDPPEIVTTEVQLEYLLVNNTTSYNKRSYGQFWDYSFALFGTVLPNDLGLNFEEPDQHYGLSGFMTLKGNHFQATGIPATPVDDSGTWDPYQIAEIIAWDEVTGVELARTRTTVPVSDEIDCTRCHGINPFIDILQEHDDAEGTLLVNDRPVLCASCHGSPALGQSGPGSSGMYLSEAVHGFHADKNATCYNCHPGSTTQCSRSTAHTDVDGNCVTCHGEMSEVSGSITSGARVPWVDEPNCAACHIDVAEVDTGAVLYRDAAGHHGLSCPACHGSPHAMIPSEQESDHYQALQYQNVARPLGSCRVCHEADRGGGIENFLDAHGGNRATSCTVCHLSVTTDDTANWPHRFQWGGDVLENPVR